MQWLNPAGAWAFLALIPVLALYFLRKRAKQVKVPSLLLWRLTQNETYASRPFQRLKSQWLLWLQLLAVALLALALMRPVSMGGTRGEIALIFDLSASMQTERDGLTRLEESKEAAYRLLDGMRETDAVTVLTAGNALGQPVSRTTDHAAARRAIAGLKAQNGGADVAGAVALAQAMRRELPEMSVTVFSDVYEGAPAGVSVQNVGAATPNRSVDAVRLSEQEGGLSAFAQLRNLGGETEAEVECYADGALCDLRTVALPENGTVTARFQAPGDAQSVTVRFAQPDALAADDARVAVKPVPASHRALLVTEGNVFLEKAMALRGGLQVTQASLSDAQDAQGYDLYVYDGELPDALPESGAVLALNPAGDVAGLTPGEEKTGGGVLRAGAGEAAKTMTEHLLLTDIALKAYRPLTGGESVLSIGGDAILAVRQSDGRRAAALGFDLHQSNLPLKADFPLMMQNLLAWLLPDALAASVDASCGDGVTFALDDRTVSASVRTPTGRTLSLVEATLQDTDEVGLYTLLQKHADGTERETAFALHIPPQESDTARVAASVEAETQAGTAPGAGLEWTPWALLLCLAALVTEWEVSRRGACV